VKASDDGRFIVGARSMIVRPYCAAQASTGTHSFKLENLIPQIIALTVSSSLYGGSSARYKTVRPGTADEQVWLFDTILAPRHHTGAKQDAVGSIDPTTDLKAIDIFASCSEDQPGSYIWAGRKRAAWPNHAVN
jgi:hypothetical protein